MGRDNRRQQGVRQIGADILGVEARVIFELLQRAGSGLTMDEMVVGDVGKLREDGKSADQKRHLGLVEQAEAMVERQVGDAVAVFAD